MISGTTNWALLLLAFISNCGFFLTCFNQVNATGLRRKYTKRFEKFFLVACFALPMVVATVDWLPLLDWLGLASAETSAFESSWWPGGSLLPGWLGFFLVWAAVVGPVWLESRRWIWPPDNLLETQSEPYCVAREIGKRSAASTLTKVLERLPGNQINSVDVTRKRIRLVRPIKAARGLTIGHISDLHFTGQLSQEHYRFVLAKFQELQPDLICIAGDIIDYEKCLPWIQELLAPLEARLGKVFVLGNHDKRLPDVNAVTDALKGLGFHDAGASDLFIQVSPELSIEIRGNELPWLERHPAEYQRQATTRQTNDLASDGTLRIALSHSPDQLSWALAQRADLMLAGHTHGGQVRIPLVGPLVAPSHYGSRFASGVFVRGNTLLHVSRGVAGTHPLRYRCMPEVTELTIY